MFYLNSKYFFPTLTLALTVLFIISCSSTNKGLSPEGEILSKKALEISSFTLSVNGQEIQSFESGDLDKEISGIDALIFGAKQYGLFVVSTEKFNKSKKAGVINSEGINFKVDDLSVSIEPVNETLVNLEKERPIWVRQLHNRKSETFAFESQPYSNLNNSSYLEKLPWSDDSLVLKSSGKKYDDGTRVFIEKAPQIVGGLPSIQQKVKYPKQAIENNVSGYVRIRFKVSEDGTPYDFEFLNRLGSGCDQEALFAIKASEFIPAEIDGHPTPSLLMIPIRFKR